MIITKQQSLWWNTIYIRSSLLPTALMCSRMAKLIYNKDMQKICETCGVDFEIRKEDLIFYEQIKVPPPNCCPDCRMQRRIAFRNERTLYKRPCDLCKKDGISLYTQNTPFPIYCHQCWWGDDWDPASYAIDYDPKKSFMEQFAELRNKVPRVRLL